MNINNYNFKGFDLVIGLFLIVIVYPKIELTIRLLMIQTKPSRRLLHFFDSLLSERNLPWISTIMFLTFYFFLFIFQQREKIELIKYDQASFDLVGIYGFVIGILSMYGIYIGFLQFIVGDSDKVRYLGKSKIKYLVDTSVWYQITQTKPFLVVLFLTIVSPVFIVNMSGEMKSSFIYAWQASIMILLLIYIFLIGISLQILRILFLIKGKTDSGLESIIKNSVRAEYYRLFKKMYRSKFSSEDEDTFFYSLKFDISRVDDQSLGFFLTKVFTEISIEVGSEYGEFNSVRSEKRSYGEYKKYLYDDYKKFIVRKWELLSTVKNRIDWNNFSSLINMDLRTMKRLVAKTPKAYEKDNNSWRNLLGNKVDNIHEYLFDRLLEKAISDTCEMKNLYDDIEDSTREIAFKEDKNMSPALLEYYIEFEQYKWKKIAEYYLDSESRFKLPEFYSDSNKEWYSKSVFDFLINHYGDLREPISDNRKLMDLVFSMNKKYRVAYYLYQIFYPDSGWTKNIMFFQEKLKDIFYFKLGDEGKDLYSSAAAVVDKTHINHRITFKMLMTIFNDRSKSISSMSYFDQFKYCRTTPLKIIFTQENLYYDSKYSIRINLPDQSVENDVKRVEILCVDFLRSIDEIPEITKCEGLSYTMEYLLENIDLSIERLINDLGIVSLLYYRFILEWKKGIQTNSLFLDAVTNRKGKEISYFFWRGSTFTFFALEMIDKRYEKCFNNKQFLADFKSAGIYLLDRLDMTLDEYIEGIYETLKEAPHGKVGKASLRQIHSNLEKLLFE
ncbi:hypothetical protein [Enterococcus sp. DIV0660C]|uniref:hypothetical protein n=1 Tax=Enterococcus sp. DIV0660C TaxID=2230880 RepID=UPI001A8C0CC5|nr:hypothetical protein [Enterococcus sp. DIV0660C]MBO0431327.1 hypothetical protein [Enterococcus sp. DIV0660C]